MFKFNSLVLVLVCTISNVVLSGIYSGGDGTVETPYKISNSNDLIELWSTEADWNKSFIMTSSVNIAGIAPNRIGYSSSHSFNGIFDGNDFVISNVGINLPTFDVGLFGYVGFNGVIKNLGVEDVNIIGKEDVGGLCGLNSGLIQNCYSTGIVKGNYKIGGLVGKNYGMSSEYRGTIERCYSKCRAEGLATIGGLVGIGYYENGLITQSYSTGNVSGQSGVGGLIGMNNGTISYCYSTGLITSGSSAGGLCEYNFWGTITSCFWDVETSGVGSAGSNNYGAIGKTTAQMKDINTFLNASWDFVEVWQISLGQYPSFRTYLAPDVNFDRVVNLGDFAIFAGYWLKEY